MKPFLPPRHRGHVLVTSRAQTFHAVGICRPFHLESLPPADALAFLLARAEREEAGAEEQKAAAELAEELACLPLALEQAGAYVQVFDLYEATLIWDGEPTAVDVAAPETEPLMGMSLIYGHDLRIQAIEGGPVAIGAVHTFEDNRFRYGGQRFIGVGLLEDLLVVIAFTEPKHDVIRVISMRKATKNEERKYFRKIAH